MRVPILQTTHRTTRFLIFIGALSWMSCEIQAATVTREGRVFDVRSVRSWKVHVERAVSGSEWTWHRNQLDQSLRFLETVMPGKLSFLRTIPIWLRVEECHNQKTGGSCSGRFVWVNRPWFGVSLYLPAVSPPRSELSYRSLVLHEFAHAYHGLVLLDRQDRSIVRAWENAETSGLYRDVPDIWGGNVAEAYALTDDHEYFAELTESFYGVGTTYPFTRQELEAYDPWGYLVISNAWMTPLRNQYRPDLLVKKKPNGKGKWTGNGRYEIRPIRQVLAFPRGQRRIGFEIMLQNDGAYDRIRLTGSNTRRLKNFKFERYDRGYKPATGLFRSGRYAENWFEGNYRTYFVSFRWNSRAGSRRSFRIKSQSTMAPSKSDQVVVKFGG